MHIDGVFTSNNVFQAGHFRWIECCATDYCFRFNSAANNDNMNLQPIRTGLRWRNSTADHHGEPTQLASPVAGVGAAPSTPDRVSGYNQPARPTLRCQALPGLVAKLTDSAYWLDPSLSPGDASAWRSGLALTPVQQGARKATHEDSQNRFENSGLFS